jgi:hypothetical protein
MLLVSHNVGQNSTTQETKYSETRLRRPQLRKFPA